MLGKTFKSATLLAGLVALSLVTEAAAAVGTVWNHSRGRFQHVGGGRWHEFDNSIQTFTFQEADRGPDHVLLHDASRNIQVRLTADEAVVTQGPRFLLSLRGSWQGGLAPAFAFEGSYLGPSRWFRCEDEGVYFFAVSFTGVFSHNVAHQAWEWGVRNVASRGTLTTERIDYRTTGDRHILIGWWNPVRGRGGYLAGTNAGRVRLLDRPTGGFLNPGSAPVYRGVVRYLETSMMTSDTTAEWVWRDYTTRGFALRLGVATDNDTGDVVVVFTRPR